MSDLAPNDYDERLRLARIDAADGYGWADLVQRYKIKEDVARMYVWSAEARRRNQREAQ